MRCARCSSAARASRRRSQIAFDGAIYPVRLRRHRQARRYTLRIHAATREVVLTMPPRGSVSEAQRLRAEARRLDRGAARPPAAGRRRSPTARVLPLRGVRAPHRAPAGRARHGLDRDRPPTASACSASPATRRTSAAADRAISSSARPSAISKRRAAAPPAQLGVSIKRVSVRDQSSRWGSCSTTGVLSYSWRLILAPPFVLDYLAAHEVAHLIEMNHSREFWRLVERHLPAMRPRQSLARRPWRRSAPLRPGSKS